MAKRSKKPRVTHVVCATPADYRWLRAYLARYPGVIADAVPEGFAIRNEARWAEALRNANGQEIP